MRRIKHARPSLKPPKNKPDLKDLHDALAAQQAAAAAAGDVEPVVRSSDLPLHTFIAGVPGPDGRWWVSVQPQQGSLALAFALPPEQVEDWLRVVGRDMRAQAAECRKANGGKQSSGLIVAGASDVPRFPAR